jgi:Lrp/AsnC family transcriptional regulator for asnA, asnC and gidA
MPPGQSLDELDRSIVRELQQDGRRPFREIARTLDVSERTVRARMRRMEAEGVLRVLAFVDPFALAHSILALVLLRVEADAHDRIIETVTAWDEVSYVSTLIGRADVYLQVICRDTDHLWQLVTRRLRGLDGVLETETMVENKVHKFVYAYPVEAPDRS